MIRTTTPTHTFTFPFDPADASEMWITYTQNGDIKLEKHLEDLIISSVEKTVSFTLTQEETKSFVDYAPVFLQVKCRIGETVMASVIYTLSVEAVLNDTLMGVTG